MKVTVSLAVIASAALAASASPSHSFLAALLGRQGQDLHARAGTAVDPSSIASQCQSSCTNIVKTLNACSGSAACECTQSNFNALGVCIDCLSDLAPPSVSFSPGFAYLTTFFGACEASGAQLKSYEMTGTPTGSPGSTADPLSPFEIQIPTGTDLSQLTATLPPLVPTPQPGAVGKGNSGNSGSSGNSSSGSSGSGGGGAIGLNPIWALGTSAVVAVVVAIAMEGVSLL